MRVALLSAAVVVGGAMAVGSTMMANESLDPPPSAIEAKKEAYSILVGSILAYKERTPEETRSFADFLAQEWPQDSKLYLSKERSYEEWTKLYDTVF